MSVGLLDLPEEVLQEIHLLALNPFFPQSNRLVYSLLRHSGPTFVANYLLELYADYGPDDVLVRSVRHPICSVGVAREIRRLWDRRQGDPQAGEAESSTRRKTAAEVLSDDPDQPSSSRRRRIRSRSPEQPFSHEDVGEDRPHQARRARLTCCEVPRRLFRPPTLPLSTSIIEQSPLHPLLIHLFKTYSPSANSHKGYLLCRAILARHMPLIRFLLNKGADPTIKNSFALEIAISTRDLSIVRLLLDRNTLSDDPQGSPEKGKKRRRLSSSVIEPRFVEMAMRKGAMDLVEYFVHEKGVMPSLGTIMDITPEQNVPPKVKALVKAVAKKRRRRASARGR